MPDVPIVAVLVLLLLQVPPEALSVSDVVAPTHTTAVPLMEPADGAGLIVTILVAYCVPQVLVTP